MFFFFFSSRRRHTRSLCDWSSDVCSSDLAVVQPVTDRPDTFLIKVPLEEGKDGRTQVRDALNTFGAEAAPTLELESDANAAYKIVGTDAVGAIAGAQLRNKAIAVTLAALVD